jgi:hypothetical protein
MGYLQILLLLNLAIITALTVAKDYSTYQYLRKKNRWLKSLTNKQALMMLTFIFLTIALFLQLVITLRSQERETEKANQDLSNYKTILKNFRASLTKSDTTFGEINNVFYSLNSVQNKTSKQLLLQDSLNDISKRLYGQNLKITSDQQKVLKNVDDLLNPIFPMDITIFISFPFDDKYVNALKTFAFKLKKANNLNKCNYKNIRFSNFILLNDPVISDTTILAEISNPDSVLSGEALSDFHNLTHYNLSFVKDKIRVNCDIKPRANQKSDFSLLIDYFNRKFDLRLEYENYAFFQTDGAPSTGNVGFNDLLNTDLLISPFFRTPNYELVAVAMLPLQGLQTDYTFIYNNKDVIRDEYKGKIYKHKIKNSDLSVHQPKEIFFNR